MNAALTTRFNAAHRAGWVMKSIGCRRIAIAILLAGALGLSACQSLAPAVPEADVQFIGRLAVKVDGDEKRSFSSGFELRGDERTGSMTLSNPLGSQVGRADWSTGNGVRMSTGDGARLYDSLDAMAEDLTGQALPIAALFDWLDGRPWPAAPHKARGGAGQPGFQQLGWEVQLDRLDTGLIVAVREQPLPRVTVRAKLDLP